MRHNLRTEKEAMHVSQNKNLEIGKQLNFILEIKLQKHIFFIKIRTFFSDLCVHFESFLGWGCAYVCYDLKTEKEEIYVKKRE